MLRNTFQTITRLCDLAAKYPDLRLCQIIGNAVPAEVAQKYNNDFYYVEDEQLLQWLEEYDHKITKEALERASKQGKD